MACIGVCVGGMIIQFTAAWELLKDKHMKGEERNRNTVVYSVTDLARNSQVIMMSS